MAHGLCGPNAVQFVLAWHGVDLPTDYCIEAIEVTPEGARLEECVDLLRTYGCDYSVKSLTSVEALPPCGAPYLLPVRPAIDAASGAYDLHLTVLFVHSLPCGLKRFIRVDPPSVVVNATAIELDSLSVGFILKPPAADESEP